MNPSAADRRSRRLAWVVFALACLVFVVAKDVRNRRERAADRAYFARQDARNALGLVARDRLRAVWEEANNRIDGDLRATPDRCPECGASQPASVQ